MSEEETQAAEAAAQAAAAAAAAAAEEAAKATPKTFTQEELDRVLADRLKREREKYGDYEELKAKADRLKELEDADKDELTRAQERIGELEQGKTDAEKRAERILIRSAVLAEAAKQGAADPETVLALLKDAGTVGGKTPKVIIGDDDQVTGTQDAVTALLEAKKFLVGSRRPGPGDGGARTTAPSEGDLSEVNDPAKVRELAKKLRTR